MDGHFPLLAIDPGTQCGWASIADAGADVASGVVIMEGGNTGAAMATAERRFASMIEVYEPALVYVENGIIPKHMDRRSTMKLFGFRCILEMVAHRRGIPVRTFEPRDIKWQIAGSRSADKAAMIRAVEQLGYSPSDDNEADAIAILECAMWKECPKTWSARDAGRLFKFGRSK